MQQSAARQIRPVLIGIGLTILMLAGLAYLTEHRRATPRRQPPALRILEPASGTIDSPLTIRFVSSSPLRLQDSGWGANDLHLHALINGTSHMPASRDITFNDSSYTWTIPSARRGSSIITLGWADRHHRELSSGASDTIRALIR